MLLGAHDTLRPLAWLPAPHVHPPRLDSAVAIGPVHYQGGRTGLFDRTGALIACQPAGTRCLGHGVAVALLGHWLRWPLPVFLPPTPILTRAGGKATVGCNRYSSRTLIFTVPIPRFRVGRAVIQNRGSLHQQHDLLRTDTL